MRRDAGQLPGRAPLDSADLLRGDVRSLGAEPARFLFDVNLQLFHAVVEDPHQPRVPADPDPTGEILRRHRVIRVIDLDMAIAMHRAAGLVERRERLQRQRQQCSPLDFGEMFADVSTCGPVHASVGHGQLPVVEEPVLFLQGGEAPPSQGVFLDVIDAPLDLPLVAGRVGTRWQEHGPVMFAEGADLGVDLRVEPVGLLHGRLEVVQDQPPGDAAEVPEGALQAAEEVIGGLAVDDLAVALAGVAEHDAEHMGLAPLAVGADDRGSGAEIDLGLVARLALDATEGQLLRLLESADEPADAVVATHEAVVGDQVLVDPLCAEAEVALGPDQLPPRLTATGPTAAMSCGSGVEPGVASVNLGSAVVLLRAEGALAGFARRRPLPSRGAHWLVLAVGQPVECDGRRSRG